MDCPSCKSSMIILELNQVEIDYCNSCKGIWLDSGELDLLFNSASSGNINDFLNKKSDHLDAKRCPICKKKMELVEFENSGIILDRCTNNHGLWFDNGELRTLLKTSEESNNKMIDLLKEMFGE